MFVADPGNQFVKNRFFCLFRGRTEYQPREREREKRGECYIYTEGERGRANARENEREREKKSQRAHNFSNYNNIFIV